MPICRPFTFVFTFHKREPPFPAWATEPRALNCRSELRNNVKV